MPMWGASTTDEHFPRNLSIEQQTRTYADNRGWVIVRPGHRDVSAGRHGKGEVLVTIRGLQQLLGSSNVSFAWFLDPANKASNSPSYSTGTTGKVRVTWNERITPTTTGTLIIKQQLAGTSTVTNITATRVGNTTSNFVDFQFTAPSTTGATLWIPAQTISLGVIDVVDSFTSGLVLATSNVIYAGTGFRTGVGGNLSNGTRLWTNTSVTTTA